MKRPGQATHEPGEVRLPGDMDVSATTAMSKVLGSTEVAQGLTP